MFDYLYSIIAALLGTTATLVGIQQAPPSQHVQDTRHEDGDVRFDDHTDRPDDIEDIMRDIEREPRFFDVDDIAFDDSATELQNIRSRNNDDDEEDEWEVEDERDEWEDDEDEEDDEREERSGREHRSNNAAVVTPATKQQLLPTATSLQMLPVSVVQKHASATDCWVVYQGVIYDITSIIPWHPGGAGAITPYCGTTQDFARAFTKQHGTSQVGALMKRAAQKGSFQ
jgi:cytochrome b involved in lipid metabolism